MEYQALVLVVALQSVARAGGDDTEPQFKIDFQAHNQGQPGSSLPATPWWFIGVIAVMAFLFLIAVVTGCCCPSRRQRMMMAHQTLTPAPLAPVMSGADMYGSLRQQPPLLVTIAPPLAIHPPQQRCYPPQAVRQPQVPQYAAQNVDPFQRPSAPVHQAPLDAPPPYNSQPLFIQ